MYIIAQRIAAGFDTGGIEYTRNNKLSTAERRKLSARDCLRGCVVAVVCGAALYCINANRCGRAAGCYVNRALWV